MRSFIMVWCSSLGGNQGDLRTTRRPLDLRGTLCFLAVQTLYLLVHPLPDVEALAGPLVASRFWDVYAGRRLASHGYYRWSL